MEDDSKECGVDVSSMFSRVKTKRSESGANSGTGRVPRSEGSMLGHRFGGEINEMRTRDRTGVVNRKKQDLSLKHFTWFRFTIFVILGVSYWSCYVVRRLWDILEKTKKVFSTKVYIELRSTKMPYPLVRRTNEPLYSRRFSFLWSCGLGVHRSPVWCTARETVSSSLADRALRAMIASGDRAGHCQTTLIVGLLWSTLVELWTVADRIVEPL